MKSIILEKSIFLVSTETKLFWKQDSWRIIWEFIRNRSQNLSASSVNNISKQAKFWKYTVWFTQEKGYFHLNNATNHSHKKALLGGKKKYHSGERPFSCQHWSKTFVEELQLKYHIRVHTKQKSISCNTCGESFKNAHTLGQHQNVHTGERCFKCKICEQIIWSKRSSFKTYDNPRGIWMWPMWQILCQWN